MTDRKKHKHEEEIVDASAEAVATSENTEQLSAEIDALKKKLEESESRASEYKDGWMRSQAEFQNYRKRIERDNEMMYSSMKGAIIRKVLPALDDLERARQNRPAEDAWVNGIELIARKLQSMLEGEGVTRIE